MLWSTEKYLVPAGGRTPIVQPVALHNRDILLLLKVAIIHGWSISIFMTYKIQKCVTTYCGIFAQSKNRGARETAITR
jgi:hypothetical protein